MRSETRVTIDPTPVKYLLKWGSDDWLTTTFINDYLIPLQGHLEGDKVQITKPGFRFDHIPFWILNVKPPETNPEVYDPTLKLNHLLRDVMQTGNRRWMRQPETSKEQLYHFLFHLRGMMEYIAVHPIGETINVTPADRAHEIIQLPKRHAFVHCGNDIGRIVTAHTLPPMDEDTALGNYVLIKLQTREKYCAQVNVANPQPFNQPQQPPVPRWEEM